MKGLGYDGRYGYGTQKYNIDGDALDPFAKVSYIKKHIILPNLKLLSTKNRALDVGCGNGRLSYVLSEYFQNVDAIDPVTSQDLRFSKDNIIFQKTSLEKFYSKEQYDLVFFWGSFYVMSDYAKTLKLVSDLISKNGLVIITEDANRRQDRTKQKTSRVCYNLDKALKQTNLKELKEYILKKYRVTIIGEK
jgi:2-polyprenyl-3-methyl-5-hydroxy-6-metoxy-1,4-benzoquinol methylase